MSSFWFLGYLIKRIFILTDPRLCHPSGFQDIWLNVYLSLQTLISEGNGTEERHSFQCENRSPGKQPIPVPEFPESVTPGRPVMVRLSTSFSSVFDDGGPQSWRNQRSEVKDVFLYNWTISRTLLMKYAIYKTSVLYPNSY